MGKKLIRLTESDLHRIVKESVKRILREEDFDSPLQKARNSKPGALGQIQDFDRNKGYIEVNGQWMPLQQAYEIGREKLIQELQTNGTSMSFWSSRGNARGSIEVNTPDGWYFISEDIPVDIEIDSHAYYTPATRWDPEEWGDTEGHVEEVDFTAMPIECFPPQKGKEQSFNIKVDPELEKVLNEYCDVDDIDNDTLCDMEQAYSDYEAGRYDDYINMQIDRARGED